MNTYALLEKRISTKKSIVGIIGMGYVGQALTDIILRAGFTVIGFDVSHEKVNKLNNAGKRNFKATLDKSLLANCDIILICVQTPIYSDKTPNLHYVIQASDDVAKYLKQGQLIVIESSIAPGTTRNVVYPILQTSGLSIEEDYFLAASPERVDPGNSIYSIDKIPKILAGFGMKSENIASTFYKQFITSVIPVSTLETAEFTKMFENRFRLINISFVMEMREYTNVLNIDIHEVIAAAATKPFGYLAHYPGPGVGGHCIPVDPYYILEDAKKYGIQLGMIEQAGEINDQQPYKIVESVYRIVGGPYVEEEEIHNNFLDMYAYTFPPQRSYQMMQSQMKGGRSIRKRKKKNILLLGITYKPDVDDIRESPALKVWDLLEDVGYNISYHDKYIPTYRNMQSVPLVKSNLTDKDLVILLTNHSYINYQRLQIAQIPILDTKHVYQWKSNPNIYHL